MKSSFQEQKPSSICCKASKKTARKGGFIFRKKSKARQILYKTIRACVENKGVKKRTFQIVYLPNIRKNAKTVERMSGICYTIRE